MSLLNINLVFNWIFVFKFYLGLKVSFLCDLFCWYIKYFLLATFANNSRVVNILALQPWVYCFEPLSLQIFIFLKHLGMKHILFVFKLNKCSLWTQDLCLNQNNYLRLTSLAHNPIFSPFFFLQHSQCQKKSGSSANSNVVYYHLNTRKKLGNK
jgi:hypothetical protein